MRQYFLNPGSGDDLPARILAWMEGQGYMLVAQVPDQTYKKMDVYRKQP